MTTMFVVYPEGAEPKPPVAVFDTKEAAEKFTTTPIQITRALDSRMLHGPLVDVAVDAREPDVDEWETGVSAPSFEQVRRLAALTKYPLEFFFVADPGPDPDVVFICPPPPWDSESE